ncbi:MAG: RluA family pseudouridine synthase [Chitinophagaceae bacterium]
MRVEELIVFADYDLIAINKPAGLLTIPDREGKSISLKQLLQHQIGEVYTVHRLDRETSGIVVFARNAQAHKHVSMQFEHRETSKIYLGLVTGSPEPKTGTINEPIAEHPVKKGVMTIYRKGKEAITDYEVLSNFRSYSWMQFRIHTGRTHQIRVHMNHFGHPIVCDALYGDGKPVFISQLKHKYNLAKTQEEEKPILNRLALHASQLTFRGVNAEQYNLEAPLPKDMRALLNQLNKWKKQ